MSLRLLIGYLMRRVLSLSALASAFTPVRRVLTLGALSTVALAGVAVGAVYPTPAYADATPNGWYFDNVGAGGDVSYLPSSQNYAGMTDNQRLNLMAQNAYASMKTVPQSDEVRKFAASTGVTTKTPLSDPRLTVDLLPEEVAKLKTVGWGGGAVGVLGTAGEAIGGYYLGVGLVNGVASIMGIDAEGIVCRATADGSVGSTLIRIADGRSCAADPFAPTYKKNADVAPTHQPGWIRYPLGWGCPSDSGPITDCYGIYTITPQPRAVSGTQKLVIANQVTNKAQYGVQVTGWCRSPDGRNESITGISGGSFNFDSQDSRFGLSSTAELTCVAPQVLYAFSIGSSFNGGYDPDRYYANDSRTWFSPLSPNAGAPEPPANPKRVMKCITMGDNNVQYDGPPNEYTEAADAMPTPTCADLPAGVLPKHVEVQRTTEGKNKPDVLQSWDTDQKVLDTAKQYPACTVHSLCNLSLEHKVGANWETCTDGSPACADWFTSPTKTDDYRCVYGIVGSQSPVSLDECDIYRERYTPAAQQSGNTVTDPQSGKPLPNPRPVNNPRTDAGMMNQPVSGASDQRQPCFPSGYSAFNPVNWVLQPVKCALEWAFVPRASVLNKQMTQMQQTTKNSGIGSFQTIVSGFSGFVAPSGSCKGPPLTINYFGQHSTYYPFNACDEPVKGVATTVKTILGATISLGALLAIVRYVTSIFGGIQFGGAEPESKTVMVDSRTGEVL